VNSHEATTAVIIPLTLLSIASIFFGFVFADLFVGIGTDFFGNALFIHPNHITLVEAEFSLPLTMKLLPSVGSVIAAVSAILLYHRYSSFLIDLTDNKIGRKLYTFFNGKYLIDIIYNNYIINGGLKLGYIINKTLDRGLIEVVGPYGISESLLNTGKNLSN
jgi:NADH-ubiquinone oxidoreductase chain 5